MYPLMEKTQSGDDSLVMELITWAFGLSWFDQRVSLDAFYPSFMKGLSRHRPINIGIRLYWTGVGLSHVCYKTGFKQQACR